MFSAQWIFNMPKNACQKNTYKNSNTKSFPPWSVQRAAPLSQPGELVCGPETTLDPVATV